MRAMLPNTEWQHITFTMPDELWPIFKQNRHLLKHLSRLAATTLLDYSAGKGCTPGFVFRAPYLWSESEMEYPRSPLNFPRRADGTG